MDPIVRDAVLGYGPIVLAIAAFDVWLVRRYHRWWQVGLVLLPTVLLGFWVYLEVALAIALRALIRALFGLPG